MSTPLPTNVRAWLAEPMPREVLRAVERIARAPDVRHVAVMPDVHLAHDVCVGTVVATERLIYPAAVGSDIGCGIAAVAFDAHADIIRDADVARRVLDGLASAVPIYRQPRGGLPANLAERPLSSGAPESCRRHDGAVQFGTLGRGNHFLELQRDDDGRLWLMIHSGSRAVGQAVRDFHESRAQMQVRPFKQIDADSVAGAAYLADAAWARDYARASRRAMIDATSDLLRMLLDIRADPTTYFDCDHNHVRRETHFGREFWVHRKGAMSADDGEPGAIPGSMGTETFHVTGRGNPASLRSTSHGAGRALSRDAARRSIRPVDLTRQMQGVYFAHHVADTLREEAPSAYKDVRAVLRAESDLTRVVRRLQPVLVYKGG